MSADFWAGYVSGAAGIAIGNPLDLIKVRVQTQHTSSSTNTHIAPTSRPHITSLAESLSGLPAPILTYGALNALLFTTYNRSLLLLAPPSAQSNGSAHEPLPTAATPAGTYPYWAHFTAGALAGLATFVLSAPTELVKCRAQVLESSTNAGGSLAQPKSSWTIAKTIFQQHGIRGLYHGGIVTSARDALGYGAYFWTYEASKGAWDTCFGTPLRARQHNSDASIAFGDAAKILLCGGLAGIATWASIFPLDVIKTRVQTHAAPVLAGFDAVSPVEQSALLEGSGSRRTPRLGPGAVQVARDAYRAEGMPVFFRGLTICCVRAFIVNAVQWAVYEWMMRYLVS